MCVSVHVWSISVIFFWMFIHPHHLCIYINGNRWKKIMIQMKQVNLNSIMWWWWCGIINIRLKHHHYSIWQFYFFLKKIKIQAIWKQKKFFNFELNIYIEKKINTHTHTIRLKATSGNENFQKSIRKLTMDTFEEWNLISKITLPKLSFSISSSSSTIIFVIFMKKNFFIFFLFLPISPYEK